MDWRSVKFDWNHARAFLITAEEGSLSAAARALGMAQPTLGRQVSALEEALGVALFERVGRGLELTPGGIALLKYVRAMGDSASNLSLVASAQSNSLEGNICISATDLVTIFAMPCIVEKLRKLHPGIRIELIASNNESDLMRREADIAIRGHQVTQEDLIARKIGDVTAHLYSSQSYLRLIGEPSTPNDLKHADFIGDNPELIINMLHSFGFDLSLQNFVLTSDSVVAQWELVKKGLGIALLPDQLANKEPSFQKILPDVQPFKGPLWLVVHRELHMNRRVRTVFDFLVDELTRWFEA